MSPNILIKLLQDQDKTKSSKISLKTILTAFVSHRFKRDPGSEDETSVLVVEVDHVDVSDGVVGPASDLLRLAGNGQKISAVGPIHAEVLEPCFDDL